MSAVRGHGWVSPGENSISQAHTKLIPKYNFDAQPLANHDLVILMGFLLPSSGFDSDAGTMYTVAHRTPSLSTCSL